MIRLVKDLSTVSSTLIQTTNNLLLGSNEVSVYDANKIYSKGNMIVSFNVISNRYELLESLEDNITGIYGGSKWSTREPLFNEIGSIDCGVF